MEERREAQGGELRDGVLVRGGGQGDEGTSQHERNGVHRSSVTSVLSSRGGSLGHL